MSLNRNRCVLIGTIVFRVEREEGEEKRRRMRTGRCLFDRALPMLES